MSGKAAVITMTETMYEALQQFANSRLVGNGIVTRVRCILLGFLKKSNQDIAEELSISRQTVGLWRRRWRDSFAALLSLQFSDSEAKFRRCLQDVFSDAPRSGTATPYNR